MAGWTVPVQPGPSQQIHGPLPAGTTIKNTSDTHSVWVSSSQAVGPGNGQQITQLGTIRWTSDKAQLYACVDTGVLVPVILAVSDDADQITDPVTTGVAIATELALSGVYLNQRADLLAPDNIITAGGANPSITYFYDVRKYQSCAIRVSKTVPSNFAFDYSFYQTPDLTFQPFYTARVYDSQTSSPSFFNACSQSIVVRGPYLGVIMADAGNTITVIGSTATIPRDQFNLSTANPSHAAQPSQSWSGTNAVATIVGNGLPVTVTYAYAPKTMTGYFYMTANAWDNSSKAFNLIDTSLFTDSVFLTGRTWNGNVILPYGIFQVMFNVVTTGTGAIHVYASAEY